MSRRPASLALQVPLKAPMAPSLYYREKLTRWNSIQFLDVFLLLYSLQVPEST